MFWRERLILLRLLELYTREKMMFLTHSSNSSMTVGLHICRNNFELAVRGSRKAHGLYYK